MENKICTSVEQSERLIDLGLDPKTADMYYMNGNNLTLGSWEGNEHDWDDIPGWSLGSLLNLMPEIKTEYGIMQPYLVGGTGTRFKFMCFYKITYNTLYYENPLDAAYEMVCWLLENKHIKI